MTTPTKNLKKNIRKREESAEAKKSCLKTIKHLEVPKSIDGNNVNKLAVRKLRSFSMKEKLQILQQLENESMNSVCEKESLHNTVLRRWIKQKEVIQKAVEKEELQNCKKWKKATNEDVDNAVHLWLLEMQDKGISVTGTQIKNKALSVNKEQGGNKEFKASNGWLVNFKRRNGIKSYTKAREKLLGDVKTLDEFKKKVAIFIKTKHLTRAQVFHFSETELSYKNLPVKNFPMTNEDHKFKNNKERVTIGVCCNADGSLKIPLILVEKSDEPRAMQNLSGIFQTYKNKKNALISSTIINDWFRNEFVPRVETFLKGNNLPIRAMLLVENCRTFSKMQVGQIEIDFLPSKATSFIQPLDQGILECLKRRYKTQLILSILEAQEDGMPVWEFLNALTLKDVMYSISEAWEQINPGSIYKCWNKVWPIETRNIAVQTENETLFDSPVGAESEETFIHGVDRTVESIIEKMKRINNCNSVSERSVFEWLTDVENWGEIEETSISEAKDTIEDAAEKNSVVNSIFVSSSEIETKDIKIELL